jgi:hypothetical protein
MTAETSPDPSATDTIALIHGLWMTPRSWEKWVERYEGRGYRVLAPAYPGLEVEVEALREDPSPIEALTPRDCQRAGCVQKAQAVCRRAARRSPYTRGYAQQRRSHTYTAGKFMESTYHAGGEERWLKRRDVRQESAGHVSGEA